MYKLADELGNEPTIVINGRRGVRRSCLQCQGDFAAERHWLRKGQAKYCSPDCYQKSTRSLSVEDNFWQHIQKTDTCWIWTGTIGKSGHGYVISRRLAKRTGAHRISWELHNGPIPEGLCVCHNCPGGDNPACCNPAHLFLGTQADNMVDAKNKKRIRSGSRHHATKFSEDQIAVIFEMHRSGQSHRSIATRLGVTHMTIGRIIRGQSWTHVERH